MPTWSCAMSQSRFKLPDSFRVLWQLLAVAGLVLAAGCAETKDQEVGAVDVACTEAANAILAFRLAQSDVRVDVDAISSIGDLKSGLVDGELREGFQALEDSMKEFSERDLDVGKTLVFRRNSAEVGRLCLEMVSPEIVDQLGVAYLQAVS